MKKTPTDLAAYVVAAILIVLAYVCACGYALMLLIGYAHSWDKAIPTIGFVQSLAPAILIRLLTTSVSPQKKKENK